MSVQLDRRQFAALAASVAAAALLRQFPPAPRRSAPRALPDESAALRSRRVPGPPSACSPATHQNNYAARAQAECDPGAARHPRLGDGAEFLVNGLKREELIAMNSIILHEYYFDAIGGGGDPTGRWQMPSSATSQHRALACRILRHGQGARRRFRLDHPDLVAAGQSPRQRVGGRPTHNLANGHPILPLDMYEPSYHMDYGANAGAYVDAFMQVIRWDLRCDLSARGGARAEPASIGPRRR